ncbi:MAG: lamin tail domain-containing protein, partial [Verrucomicrobiales bacterium]
MSSPPDRLSAALLRLAALAAILLTGPTSSLADTSDGLRLTEFSAESDGSFPDEDGENSDWIELRNTGDSTVDLGDYFLTDDADDPTQWRLPSSDLAPGELVIVFASGKDRSIAGAQLHANFSLSAGGEYLALFSTASPTPVCEFATAYPRQFFGLSYGSASGGQANQQTYIETPAAATWFIPSSEIGTSWAGVDFDDSPWAAAETGIGFGFGYDQYLGQDGNIGAEMQGVNPGAYIRIPFEVEDAASVVSLELSLLYEDGFVAYVNGTRVAAENVPAELAYDSAATDSGEIRDGDEPVTFDLDFAGSLVGGQNVLAIHVLNQTISSSDVLVVPELNGLTVDGDLVTGYMSTPTPGTPNTPIDFVDYVRDTGFDVDRGFFDSPFDVTISSSTPGATLVYTTDSNSPTLSNGTQVAPADADTPPAVTLNITGTTIVRAAAFKDGLKPTNVDTQSYLFLEDVLDQPDDPPGYPSQWVTRSGSTHAGGADYEMDQEIVGPVYSREELKDALAAIPTFSIVTDIDNLFDQQIGIQMNPQDAGPASERPISVELMGFEGTPAVQLDAGMRMNGNASRSPTRPKHNFRVIHRNEYGPGRLSYPMFGDDAPVDRFNQYILRGGNGNAWIHPSASVYNNAMYIRDQWFRDAHMEMGYPEALQREAHVYFNGLYWGMHHLFERIEEEWTAERFGGDEDDWEGFRIVAGNNIEIIAGTPEEEVAGILDSWRASVDAALAGDLDAFQEY